MIVPWIKVQPKIDPYMRDLCQKPYYGHKKGCPNYNHRPDCPPVSPMLYDLLDLTKSVYAVYNIYDLRSHTERMRMRHPEWSEHQVYCCLYWQNSARKALRGEIHAFLRKHSGYYIVGNPEATGVNITYTMDKVGICLPWPPKEKAYQIVLAGRKK